MIAAHPIMPNHGGKIMCHILVLFSQQSQHEVLFKRVGAIGLVMGGTRARQVFETIQTEASIGKKKYRASFLNIVSDIQDLATQLQKKNEHMSK